MHTPGYLAELCIPGELACVAALGAGRVVKAGSVGLEEEQAVGAVMAGVGAEVVMVMVGVALVGVALVEVGVVMGWGVDLGAGGVEGVGGWAGRVGRHWGAREGEAAGKVAQSRWSEC
jgi:hypothetical protein